jgi:Flp pilus assembly protein TadG
LAALPPARATSDHGQATAELAVVLPVVVMLMLLIVQVGAVAYQRILVVHTAREVARAAAVSPLAPTSATVAARHGLDPARLEVTVSTPDLSGYVRAVVAYDVPTNAAVVGALLPDVRVEAEAQMLAEWPRDPAVRQ